MLIGPVRLGTTGRAKSNASPQQSVRPGDRAPEISLGTDAEPSHGLGEPAQSFDSDGKLIRTRVQNIWTMLLS